MIGWSGLHARGSQGMSGEAVSEGLDKRGSVLTPGGSGTVLVVTWVVVVVDPVDAAVDVVVPGSVVVVVEVGGAVQSLVATEMSLPVWTVTMLPGVTIAGS